MRTLLFVFVVLMPVCVHADEPKPPTHPGLMFLHVNRWGAEEWMREDGAVMVRIPKGVYLQRPYEGDGTTREPKPVEVGSYFIDKFEVTIDLASDFLTLESPKKEWLAADQKQLLLADLGDGDVFAMSVRGLGQHPVTALTGEGARAYAKSQGCRLPSKTEWEKAAGGPQGHVYPWGDAAPDTSRANFGRPKPTGLMRVGSFAAGASPYGVMDMAGNAYDRVMDSGSPAMIKGGSWLSPHPLNLRVLDMCMQSPKVAEGSVGFRCVMKDQDPERPTHVPPTGPRLKVAKDLMDAVEDAQARRLPIFFSLQYDTCGQCDRMRAQMFRDPRFVKYCNENLVVVVGHQSGDALTDGHKAGADGMCPFYPDLECWEHHTLFRQAMRIVGGFQVSPGNFVLHPDLCVPKASKAAFLVREAELSKWGNDVDGYLAAFGRAVSKLKASDAAKKTSDEK